MKRTQARVVLRARLPQADVATDDTNDIGLLLKGLREVVAEGHEVIGVEMPETAWLKPAAGVLLGI